MSEGLGTASVYGPAEGDAGTTTGSVVAIVGTNFGGGGIGSEVVCDDLQGKVPSIARKCDVLVISLSPTGASCWACLVRCRLFCHWPLQRSDTNLPHT
jgi:hypothetical protein